MKLDTTVDGCAIHFAQHAMVESTKYNGFLPAGMCMFPSPERGLQSTRMVNDRFKPQFANRPDLSFLLSIFGFPCPFGPKR